MAATVYVVMFWLDSAQTAVHKAASLSKDDVIAAACRYVVALKVESADYENFLLAGIGEWDGAAINTIIFPQGKLVLFSVPLESGDLSFH